MSDPTPDFPADPNPDVTAPRDGASTAPEPRARISTPVLVGAMAGALLLLAFGIAILRQGGKAPGSTGGLGRAASASSAPTRTAPEGAPVPLSPMGAVPHAGVSFHWRRGAGMKEYRAVLYDNLAQVIWQSEPTSEESVELPRNVFANLTSGPAYFWKVIGYRADGTEVPSNGAQFTLAP